MTLPLNNASQEQAQAIAEHLGGTIAEISGVGATIMIGVFIHQRFPVFSDILARLCGHKNLDVVEEIEAEMQFTRAIEMVLDYVGVTYDFTSE